MSQANEVKKISLRGADGTWIWEKHYPEGLTWRLPLSPEPIQGILDRAVKKYADHTLCDFMGKSYTYGEIAALSDKVAGGLQSLGVKKGVKVGLFLPNTPYAIIFYFGILKAGGTVVNYNPLYVERELEHQIEDSESDFMITLDLKPLMDKMDHMLRNTRVKKVIVCPMAGILPFPKSILLSLFKRKDLASVPDDGRHVRFDDLIRHAPKPAPVDVSVNEDVAVLQYTGGTTGVAKGAMLTHANISSNMQQIGHWISRAVTPGKDSIIGILPLFHVFGMTVVMDCAIDAGMKIILYPKFMLKDILEGIQKHRASFFPAVPSIFNAIAVYNDVEKYDFSSLKCCISGGAPLPGDVKRQFEEKTGFPNLGEGYGLTETSPGVAFNPIYGGKVKLGSSGLPAPGTVIEILSTDGKDAVLSVGERGEICITGPQVMKGYYRRPEETANVIKNGRLHTGDIGYLDDEGYLFIVDRIKDLILVRGYNVYPRVVEEAIYLHPSVEECIAAGVPDAERGENVWAWVKLAAGRQLTEVDLMKFLEDKLNPIEFPRKIIFRDKPLPRTAVGKLSRKDLLIEEGIKRNGK